MNSIQNIQFSLLIKVNSRLHEFNFRRRLDHCYDADTSDGYSNRYYFRILVNADRWSMMGANLPAWIIEGETSIIRSLKEAQI